MHRCVGMRLSEEQQRGLCVESVWSTAGQLQRDFNALRVERRIPVVLLRPMYRLMYYHAPSQPVRPFRRRRSPVPPEMGSAGATRRAGTPRCVPRPRHNVLPCIAASSAFASWLQ